MKMIIVYDSRVWYPGCDNPDILILDTSRLQFAAIRYEYEGGVHLKIVTYQGDEKFSLLIPIGYVSNEGLTRLVEFIAKNWKNDVVVTAEKLRKIYRGEVQVNAPVE